MSIILEFIPWAPFYARKDPNAVKTWLQAIGEAAKEAFISGMRGYPPASSPGEYPAIRTGGLRGSIAIEVNADSMTIGSNMRYSIYLRTGTSRMARRKMSDDALKEGMAKSHNALGHWVRWERA